MRWRPKQLVEPTDAPPQCAHGALPTKSVPGMHNGPEKIGPLLATLNDGFTWMQCECETFTEKAFNLCFPGHERCHIWAEQYNVIDITNVTTKS